MDVVIDQDADFSANLRETDEVSSIIQNIALLLNTKKGTIPMYREFGLPMEFVDKPMNVAETIATLEISEALEAFEPRATLKDLRFKPSNDGRMSIQLEVTINV
ncbi:MAG: GPW/gp25 family protein [Oscillospiraceae bacterium]|nr:GPW/gp25 family protein [Oscillospiraceae bacterium]